MFPHFDYCCAVYNHLIVKQNIRFHRLLNACVRYVFGNIPWQEHVTSYHLAFGWLSASRWRKYFIRNLGYKVSKFETSTYLSESLISIQSRLEIRHSQRPPGGFFLSSHARTEELRKSLVYCAIRVVNSLGDEVSNDLSEGKFQSTLRNHLYDLDHEEWAQRASDEGPPIFPPQLRNDLPCDVSRTRLWLKIPMLHTT